MYDSDKSNYVSHGELVHMLTLLFNIKNIKESPVEKADLVMRLIDKDQDGLLSKHEFIQACLTDKDMINLLEAWFTIYSITPLFELSHVLSF